MRLQVCEKTGGDEDEHNCVNHHLDVAEAYSPARVVCRRSADVADYLKILSVNQFVV